MMEGVKRVTHMFVSISVPEPSTGSPYPTLARPLRQHDGF